MGGSLLLGACFHDWTALSEATSARDGLGGRGALGTGGTSTNPGGWVGASGGAFTGGVGSAPVVGEAGAPSSGGASSGGSQSGGSGGVSTGGTGGVPPDPALCGNGQLDAREACDDGNRAAQNGSTDFCSADCGTSTWPCGSWPDPVRSEVELEACRFYVSNVSVNGSATGYAVVKAGSVFATTSTLTYQDCGYCPGCYVQGYAGLIAGASPAQNDGVRAGCDTYQGCEENLQRGDNALEVTYTAPAQPGTYYYRVGFSLDYSCTAWTTCPPAAANSFAVCVVP